MTERDKVDTEGQIGEMNLSEITESITPIRGLGNVTKLSKPRERTLTDRRAELTKYLILLVATLAVGTIVLVAVLPESRVAALREFLPVIYAPLVTLVGTSFGWFFATTDRADPPEADSSK